MLNLILDATTIYTVNHLQTIPGLLNDLLHRLFIGDIVLVSYLTYDYILLLIKDETKKQPQKARGAPEAGAFHPEAFPAPRAGLRLFM